MAERKAYYVRIGLVSQEESDKLFISKGNLTQDDLNRKVSVTRVSKSTVTRNSLSENLYKVNYTVRYSGETTSFQIVFFVNSKGCIYKHELVSGI